MALFKPSRSLANRLAQTVQPELRRRERAFNAALTKLARTHKGKPLPVVERAVDKAASTVGVSLDRGTKKKVAMLIHLGEGT